MAGRVKPLPGPLQRRGRLNQIINRNIKFFKVLSFGEDLGEVIQ
jgi:hypothetical protein